MKKKSRYLFFISIAYFLPQIVVAQAVHPLIEGFGRLLGVLVWVILALALLFFLWGMALFILNAGNEDKRKEGKQKMLWGIIALTVMVGVWGIVQVLQIAFGIGSPVFIQPPPFPLTAP